MGYFQASLRDYLCFYGLMNHGLPGRRQNRTLVLGLEFLDILDLRIGRRKTFCRIWINEQLKLCQPRTLVRGAGFQPAKALEYMNSGL